MVYIKNKYFILVGTLLAQVTIAGLYAWSVFGLAIEVERGWAADDILLAYSIAQFVFALTTLFSGRLVDARGPRLPLTIGGLLYGAGLILSSYATSPFMLVLTYGLLSGAGVGFVYVCPLSTLSKWFPNHIGLVNGLSVAVFGGGSIVFKEVITKLLLHNNVSQALLSVGILSTILILIGAVFSNNPKEFKKSTSSMSSNDYTTRQMITSSTFHIMFIMYFLAVIPGLLVLGAAKNIAIEIAGLEGMLASGVITLLALSNAASRLVSGALSDKFKTLHVLQLAFVITFISLVILSFSVNKGWFYVGVIGVAIGYGGFLALFPMMTNQQFGNFLYASNYGVMFQAYGLAALAGIVIKSIVGSFTTTFALAAACSIIGLGLSFLLKKES